MKNGLLVLLLCCLAFAGCEEKNEDKVKTIDKDGSVEMKVEINHLDSLKDIMKTEKIFWVKGQAVKMITNLDTVPALGMTQQVAENTEGEDTTVTINKNYQIFITVK
jgi:histidyl-tRNA synthetase